MKPPAGPSSRRCPSRHLRLSVAHHVHSRACKSLVRRLVQASAKGGSRDRRGDVEEEIYNLDSGWTVEGFEAVAADLNRRLKEQTGKSPSTPAAQEGEVVYSTASGWTVESIDDNFDDEDDDAFDVSDDDDLQFSSDGGGWEVVAEGEDSDDAAADDEDGDGGVPLAASGTHMSSRELLKDWAALKPADARKTSIAERAGEGVSAIESLSSHVLKRLDLEQAEATEAEKMFGRAEQEKLKKAKRRHQQLRLIAGSAAGKRLYSPQDERTRPMMEKVRGALFSMLSSRLGGPGLLPPTSRWLDVCAGTGAIGLEGLSRGCDEAHFIEFDPWIVNKCLTPNITAAGFSRRSVVHTMKCEDFFRRAHSSPRFAGGPFDFISITPPYMLVSYPELYDLLEGSPLLHEQSIVIVEYSRQNRPDIRESVNGLPLVKDRRYGRTFLAVYANTEVMD